MLTSVESTLKKLAKSQFFCVALSGGLDSMVLLYILAELKKLNPKWQLRAIHVHHGLNNQADQWQQFCEKQCEMLNIPLHVESICIESNGESIEAQAREKRYAVFKQRLKENELLLTGHHQDDQAETFLLQLMRGAGVKGLSAMGLNRRLGKGYLVRPLLDFSRDTIFHYAKEHGLDWVDDDSNQSARFDRNYIRLNIAKLLKARWPHYASSISRSATHCANAQSLLEDYLRQDYKELVNESGALHYKKLKNFSTRRQLILLRYWISEQDFLLPSTKQLDELYRTVVDAAEDATPHFCYANVVIKRFRGWITASFNEEKTPKMDKETILSQAYEQGLRQDLSSDLLRVAYYQGGEKIRLPGRPFRHKLKKLWQQWEVPPWERSSVPLIFYKKELIAVLGYAIVEGYENERNASLL